MSKAQTRTEKDSCAPNRSRPQEFVGCESILVRVRRPDGSEKTLRMPAEHLQRVMDLATGEFGDPSIIHVGPELPAEDAGGR